MSWTELGFGKHIGKTLPQILFSDPDWFFWAVENKVFDNSSSRLRAEVADIQRKATQIKVPPIGGEDAVVEYWIHSPTSKFSHFEFVPCDRPKHTGSSPTLRGEVLDMSVPRRIAKYDKTGCRSLIKSMKALLLGGASVRITRTVCERFFDEPTNFK